MPQDAWPGAIPCPICSAPLVDRNDYMNHLRSAHPSYMAWGRKNARNAFIEIVVVSSIALISDTVFSQQYLGRDPRGRGLRSRCCDHNLLHHGGQEEIQTCFEGSERRKHAVESGIESLGPVSNGDNSPSITISPVGLPISV